MCELLEWGRIHGEKAVERWITPEEKCAGEDKEAGDRGLGEEERGEAEGLAKGLFGWRKMEGAGESWGVAARRQMVALAGVVRTLPEREGERTSG